ncbi:MAG TPA: bifunctional hydroxymethylpyrimidine kinase/phosphomethylpyrimidine kinase [Methylibium sp.]|uniref:bifunctional hydroxymethylpyrimidine kinase/phosphomethylpyrimidine kinase n=1 Tax=Methylibium sp. TaxID=2067992 RepID=UPI002DBAC24B|nr:bifunctional hydroxymethylpyrimidine kinase/phosphomethylpyrimidine kinase [Methylibium sp.]HEU4460067.1 bifunctional hydroxymethylpyrimidine kinase/phosphomethylpyrimidine kinase [Methylibium sp.]
MKPPIVWSVAGLDSGGGAGLGADQRMAEACGVHLCPVAAALTAQNSVAVERVQAVEPAMLEAQLTALASDLPPAAVKTGLLGSVENVAVLARCIDRLRERDPALPVIVDPVLRASTGAAFADEALIAAYRAHLVPRASAITPNRAEATRLAGPVAGPADLPALARALQAMGAASVCITGGDIEEPEAAEALDWLVTAQARGWLAAERVATAHTHGSGCSFASAWAAAAARGFVDADAAVIAKMAAQHAVRRGEPLGAGAGAVRAEAGFILGRLPRLSLDAAPIEATVEAGARLASRFEPGLYAIVDSAEAAERVVRAGVRTVQLRIKAPNDAQALRTAIVRARVATRAAGARLVVNDHWALAIELGADAVHLGQEDLLALDAAQRRALAAARHAGLRLGISSHSLWELCRALALQPDYVACGPVWPTTTKAMPWHRQGLGNLGWWVRAAGVPVVAIGGVLAPAQAALAARCGAAGVCLVRAINVDPSSSVPCFAAAWHEGRAAEPIPAPSWPVPSLPRAQASS